MSIHSLDQRVADWIAFCIIWYTFLPSSACAALLNRTSSLEIGISHSIYNNPNNVKLKERKEKRHFGYTPEQMAGRV